MMYSTATRHAQHSTTMPPSSSATSSSHPAPTAPPPRSGASASRTPVPPAPSIRSRASRLLAPPATSVPTTTTQTPPPKSRKPKPPPRLTESEKLARDNARMEERLNALRLQLEMQKTKYKSLRRVASAGTSEAEGEGTASIWRSGAAVGGLTSHAREVLEGQKRFLKLRALDKIEYIGTVPASVVTPPAAAAPSSATTAQAPRTSSTPSTRPGSSASSSSSGGRKTWGSAASSPKPGQARADAPQSATWTVPDAHLHLDDDTADDTEPMSTHDSGFFTPAHTRPSSASRYSLDDGNPTEFSSVDLGQKRMTSLQSVYQFDQRLSRPIDLTTPKAAAASLAQPSSWWDGNVDEQANQSAFQDAVREWRAGGTQQQADSDQAAAPGKGGWWDGEYDEQANQAAFASAVRQWRGGNAKRQRPATTATCSVGTVGGEEVRKGGEAGQRVKVEFSEGMSLMERMLLRRWKREMDGNGEGEEEASHRVREATVEEAFQSREYSLE